MLELDFFADAVAYIDSKDQNPKAPEVIKEPPDLITFKETYRTGAKPELLTLDVVETEQKPEVYTIDDDKSTITIKGATYPIPTYFNKDMIRQRDKKTVDMVLIYLGYIDLT